MSWLRSTTRIKLVALICLVVVTFGVFTTIVYQKVPLSHDWVRSYRPAALKVLAGGSPYEGISYFNPPWLLVPLIQFALLPERLSNAIWLFVNLGLYIYLALRLEMRVPYILLLIVSYPVARSLLIGQVDAMILLGMFLPPWIGLFLLLAKPQISFGIVALVLVRIWRNKGWLGVVKNLIPVSLAFILTFWAYGFYPARGSEMVGARFNLSLWPYTLPVGLVTLFYVLRNENRGAALATGPLLSPYLSVHSLANFLFMLPANSVEFIIAVGGTWLIRFLGGY